jgi:tetratricopeptide (TPR) repeat protein
VDPSELQGQGQDPGSTTPPGTNIPRAQPVDDAEIPRAQPVDPSELNQRAQPMAPQNAPANTTPNPSPQPQNQSQPTANTPEARQLSAADGFYAREMWELALTQYARFLKDFPDAQGRQQALYRAAESARQLGKSQEAQMFYNALLRDYQQGEFVGPAAYRMGEVYFNEGNYSAAVSMFRRAAQNIEEEKLRISARYYEARALEQLGRHGEAKMALEEVLAAPGRQTPFSEVARLAMARMENQLGNKEKALELYESLVSSEVRADVRQDAVIQAGLLAAELNQVDKAVKYLRQVLDTTQDLSWRVQAVKVLMRMLYEAERYQEVLDVFDTYRAQIPRNDMPELLLLTAKANRKAGNLQLASRALMEIFQEYPRSPIADEAEYQYLLALYQMGEENLGTRIETFLSKNPKPEMRDRALLLLAEFHYNRENWEQAAEAYGSVAGSNHLSQEIRAEAMNRRSWSFLEMGQEEKALNSFSEFISRNPDHPLVPRAIAQRALMLTQQQNYEAAVEEFNRILKNFPDASEERELALQKKALILGQMGQEEKMMQTFEQLLEEFPETDSQQQAYWWIGQTAYDLKQYEKALEAMRKVREVAPERYGERAGVYIMLSLYNLERLEELSQAVDRFMEEKKQLRVPDEVLRWLGQTYAQREDYTQAAHYMDMAMESPSFDPHGSLSLETGLMQLRAAQYHEAVESFKTYLEQHPLPVERARGNLLLARAYMKMQQYDQAEEAVKRALESQPEGRLNGEARLAMGDIELRRGQFEDAAKTFSSVSLLYDDPAITPIAIHKAAKAFEKAGEQREARKMEEKLEENYPDFSYDPATIEDQFMTNVQQG